MLWFNPIYSFFGIRWLNLFHSLQGIFQDKYFTLVNFAWPEPLTVVSHIKTALWERCKIPRDHMSGYVILFTTVIVPTIWFIKHCVIFTKIFYFWELDALLYGLPQFFLNASLLVVLDYRDFNAPYCCSILTRGNHLEL